MSTLKSRLAALEQAKDSGFQIVRTDADGVARDSDGKQLEPNWRVGERVIDIVRSYGGKA